MNVEQRWAKCRSYLGVACAAAERLEALVAAYGAPDRHCHTLAHVMDCLEKFDRPEAWTQNKPCVQAAIWFHDAVSDSHAIDDEQRSPVYFYEKFEAAARNNLQTLLIELQG